MKRTMPLYLLDAGMTFQVKKCTYTFIGTAANGKIEARDKFGLLVEFHPGTAVKA